MADVEDAWVDIRIPAGHPLQAAMTSCCGSEDGFIMYTLSDAPEQYFIEYDGSTRSIGEPAPESPTRIDRDDPENWPDGAIEEMYGQDWSHCWVHLCDRAGTYFAYYNYSRRTLIVVAWQEGIGYLECYNEHWISASDASHGAYDRFVLDVNGET
jgi:hypothetical protein